MSEVQVGGERLLPLSRRFMAGDRVVISHEVFDGSVRHIVPGHTGVVVPLADPREMYVGCINVLPDAGRSINGYPAGHPEVISDEPQKIMCDGVLLEITTLVTMMPEIEPFIAPTTLARSALLAYR